MIDDTDRIAADVFFDTSMAQSNPPPQFGVTSPEGAQTPGIEFRQTVREIRLKERQGKDGREYQWFYDNGEEASPLYHDLDKARDHFGETVLPSVWQNVIP